MLSKKEKLKICKDMLYGRRYLSKKWLTENVFSLHHDWEQKQGVGIFKVMISKNKYGAKGFYLLRKDGSITDISIYVCFRKPTIDSQIKKACRNAIYPEIQKFKKNNITYGSSTCEFCKILLTIDNLNIDHYDLEFRLVYKEWIKSQDKEFLISKLNKSVDLCEETFFIDPEIKQNFIQFHNSNTKLRGLCKDCNLSRGKSNS